MSYVPSYMSTPLMTMLKLAGENLVPAVPEVYVTGFAPQLRSWYLIVYPMVLLRSSAMYFQ